MLSAKYKLWVILDNKWHLFNGLLVRKRKKESYILKQSYETEQWMKPYLVTDINKSSKTFFLDNWKMWILNEYWVIVNFIFSSVHGIMAMLYKVFLSFIDKTLKNLQIKLYDV